MLKRLLIAVFVLGLVTALCGTAIADIGKGPLNPVQKIDPTNPRLDQLQKAGPTQPATKKPASALQAVPGDLTVPAPPLDYFCDVESYYGGMAYFWTIPDAYGDDLFNTRFTSMAGYDCTLKVGHIVFYIPPTVGTPGLKIYLWDDDGFGFPGNKLDSVEYTGAEVATIFAATIAVGYNSVWMSADFSASEYVFSDGAEYHIGWTTVDDGSGTATLACLSDDGTGPAAGEERSSEYYGGAWGSMLNDWGGDYSFVIQVERCCSEIPFSDCSWVYSYTNIAYFWKAPHPTWGDVAYSQKFTVAAEDTLVQVDVAVYDPGDGSFGNDNIFMTIYGDDGTGLPDPANMVDQVMVAAGAYPAFPAWTSVPFGITMPGAGSYHVAFSSDAVGGVDYESCLSSDGTDGVGGSASDWGGGYWVGMLDGWGVDVNFVFDLYICKDPNSLCAWNSYNDGVAYFWRLPDIYGDIGQAELIQGAGVNCRVQEVAWYLYDTGDPLYYTNNSEVSVYTNVAGLPGIKLASITLTPADYVMFPAPTVVDFSDQQVYTSGDYWVAIESFGTDETDGIATMSDAGGSGYEDAWAENWSGTWELVWPAWGLDPDWNAVVEVYHCCLPFPETFCTPGGDDDWSTLQGNYQRTGRSMLPLGDSWCDLNLNWAYEDATQGMNFCGPTVFEHYVIAAFSDHVQVFDLNSGAILYTIAPGIPQSGSQMRSSATVEYITALGTDVLFLGGGDLAQSVLAYDIHTGTLLWSRDALTVGAGGLFGATRYMTTTVLDIGGTQVAYLGTDNGHIVAVEAATGALFAGWAVNPLDFGQSNYKSGATDGTSLFFGTYNPAGEGDVYSIDAATGVINWQLSAAGGLQASAFWGALYLGGEEGFNSGVAYDAGVLFTNSRADGDHPVDGLFYRIDAATGNLVDGTVTQSNRGRESTPIVDINRIYVPTLTKWAQAPVGGSVPVFNRASGALEFAMASSSGGRYYVDGFLTCEPEGAPDQLFVFNEDGFLSCFNADNGDEIFRRRIFNTSGYAPNIGMAGAIAPDPGTGEVHVLFGTFWGNLFDLKKGADRPRLEFYTYNPQAGVEFGPATSFLTDLGPIMTNTGCAGLTLTSLTINDASNGIDLPAFTVVDDDFMDRASTIADVLARDAFMSKYTQPRDNNLNSQDALNVRSAESKDYTNPAATAFPVFLNGINFPPDGYVVAPGEDVNIVMDVIQANIKRGPQDFYIEVASDDPDFFLNNTSLVPQIHVVLVGGCLIDTTTLYFGAGGANYQWVTNAARMGTGDWDPHGIIIDGDDVSYYQGSIGYGVSKYRVAAHSQDWTSGGGEDDAMISMQPDPNWCDNGCKPYLTAGYAVGSMWDDGTMTYVPLTGTMICSSFLDSVQNYDLGAGWVWTNWGAPFDNALTMGLFVNARTIGVEDVPELANLTLQIMDVTENNGVAVDDWYLFHFWDCDLGGDSVNIDRDISTAWCFPGNAKDFAWGNIKIPFGPCDGDPVVNVMGLSGENALWDWTSYWDEAYNYCDQGTGFFSMDMNTGDAEAHFTLAAHDFLPNETYSVGIATFAVFGLTDASAGDELAPMAHFVNKWAGFGRGDVNDDNEVNLVDIIYLANYVNFGGAGPAPFLHLGDVNNDANVDGGDITYLIDYYFFAGACPVGDWMF